MAGKKPAPKSKKPAATARKVAKPAPAAARKAAPARRPPAATHKAAAHKAVAAPRKVVAAPAVTTSKTASAPPSALLQGNVKPAPAPAASALVAKPPHTKPQNKGVIAIATMKSPPVFAPASGEDQDGEVNSSLLAGPRNVKPYVAKRGERYMSTEQLKHFQTILESWKRDLMVEVDRTVTHMKDEAANFPDPNDRATQEEEFSLELRTRDRERKLIRKIDEAVKRIEDGNYGYCLETGEEIGIKRLEARPVATLTIEAQERRERRERQYGDRDDRYR
jgi:DnaK suppressor protein